MVSPHYMIKKIKNKILNLDRHTLEVVKKSTSSIVVRIIGILVGLIISISLGHLIGAVIVGIIIGCQPD